MFIALALLFKTNLFSSVGAGNCRPQHGVWEWVIWEPSHQSEPLLLLSSPSSYLVYHSLTYLSRSSPKTSATHGRYLKLLSFLQKLTTEATASMFYLRGSLCLRCKHTYLWFNLGDFSTRHVCFFYLLSSSTSLRCFCIICPALLMPTQKNVLSRQQSKNTGWMTALHAASEKPPSFHPSQTNAVTRPRICSVSCPSCSSGTRCLQTG